MTLSTHSQHPSIRIGAIAFVNTIPVYHAYQPAPEVQLMYDVPARLNQRILAGELDVSPVSSACYLRHPEELVLLADLSVSSPGAVESVLFLSKVPLGPELLDVPALWVPNDSETSVALLAHLLKQATGQDLRPKFKIYEASDYQTILQAGGNALIIGDNALMMKEQLAQSESPLHCHDLSSMWQAQTGLPFVFAVWVARRAWAEQNAERLAGINQALRSAREQFFMVEDLFESGIALAQSRSQLPRAALERYYRHCLTYGLNDSHEESLQAFSRILQQLDAQEVRPIER
ncbi:menaquinone biosynthesis protein [Vampirovibrio chlorellavorus]|uniref:menaquinone biosynthesis protein n=1 Tax=Vampirovibrio chlorellavorus TaxID=758823 RepID=UPI0026F0CEA0|nr:menaquinone biosynthesis protein [Vampirovibrio chlorellavorus]